MKRLPICRRLTEGEFTWMYPRSGHFKACYSQIACWLANKIISSMSHPFERLLNSEHYPFEWVFMRYTWTSHRVEIDATKNWRVFRHSIDSYKITKRLVFLISTVPISYIVEFVEKVFTQKELRRYWIFEKLSLYTISRYRYGKFKSEIDAIAKKKPTFVSIDVYLL